MRKHNRARDRFNYAEQTRRADRENQRARASTRGKVGSPRTLSSIRKRAIPPLKSAASFRGLVTRGQDERRECLPLASGRKSWVNSPPFGRGRVGAPAAASKKDRFV